MRSSSLSFFCPSSSHLLPHHQYHNKLDLTHLLVNNRRAASKQPAPSLIKTQDRWAATEYMTATANYSCRRRRRRRHHGNECRNQLQYHCHQMKQKIVVIMGPTGSGKSRLSVDLATRFFPSEIINSDKIQVYSGLDITTNKTPMHERLGVPHHLLGEVDPSRHPELTPSQFRSAAGAAVSAIATRSKLPLIVGGSNSFIYALLANGFDPELDIFDESRPASLSTTELRYECCFLWVDVSMAVLNEYLSKRVDDMLDSGMFEELAEYFDSYEFREETQSSTRTGLRKAIGIPEFEPYFRKFGGRADDPHPKEDPIYEAAVRAIKENTCQLAKRQAGKIQRLRSAGWDLRRLDATEAFRAAMMGSDPGKTSDIWEKQVLGPSVEIVKRFLEK